MLHLIVPVVDENGLVSGVGAIIGRLPMPVDPVKFAHHHAFETVLHGYKGNHNKGEIMWTILLIVFLVLMLSGGGYGYSRRGRR